MLNVYKFWMARPVAGPAAKDFKGRRLTVGCPVVVAPYPASGLVAIDECGAGNVSLEEKKVAQINSAPYGISTVSRERATAALHDSFCPMVF